MPESYYPPPWFLKAHIAIKKFGALPGDVLIVDPGRAGVILRRELPPNYGYVLDLLETPGVLEVLTPNGASSQELREIVAAQLRPSRWRARRARIAPLGLVRD